MHIYKLLALAGASAMLLFAGCQGIEDEIGKTIAEKAIESATGGSMQVNSETGEVKIKTPDGEVSVSNKDDQVTVKSAEGEAVFGGGETRPVSVHDDLPNLDGATDFSWAGSKDGGMFSFSVKGTDYKTVCGSEVELLTAKGWKLKEDQVLEFEGMMSRTLENEEYSLSLNCSAEKDSGKLIIVLIKSKPTK